MAQLQDTPNANRIHIGFFGNCNAGKSTAINMLTGQEVALVSDVAGTTTDPVTKAMEILPLGPVLIVDTAGINDTSTLGALRIEKTKKILPTIHIAVYVLRTDAPMTAEDMAWLQQLKEKNIPTLILVNEVDGHSGSAYVAAQEGLATLNMPYVCSDMRTPADRMKILEVLGSLQPIDDEREHTLLEGMVGPNDHIVLVCPIDSAAPKGRLILPQVQMLRDGLDKRALVSVVQTEEIPALLARLKEPPTLVITDSQAFEEVDALVPDSIPLTSFSILMARLKGDLDTLVAGVAALKNLKPGSKVLISEGCTHRRQCDDIGTVKIPKWLAKKGYTDLDMTWSAGKGFPDDVKEYDLVIHCGACMLTRREVLRRIEVTIKDGTPIINYGVLIAYLHGILERALSPFATALLEEEEGKEHRC